MAENETEDFIEKPKRVRRRVARNEKVEAPRRKRVYTKRSSEEPAKRKYTKRRRHSNEQMILLSNAKMSIRVNSAWLLKQVFNGLS